MTIRWFIAALHLLALGIGFGAVWARGRALRSALDAEGLKRVFLADNLWGLAAILWIATGLLRAFGGLEKGTAYYLSQPMFYWKMALFIAVLLLEFWPMATLIRWRIRLRRGEPIDTTPARSFARISALQTALLILMVFAATALARGIRF